MVSLSPLTGVYSGTVAIYQTMDHPQPVVFVICRRTFCCYKGYPVPGTQEFSGHHTATLKEPAVVGCAIYRIQCIRIQLKADGVCVLAAITVKLCGGPSAVLIQDRGRRAAQLFDRNQAVLMGENKCGARYRIISRYMITA
jgi:hypothetical protein